MTDDYGLGARIRDLADSISEQFKNIARQLEIIDGKLDGKASLSQLQQVEDRVNKSLEKHEARLMDLEKQNWGSAAVSRMQKFYISLAFGGGLTAIATLVWLAVGGH